MTNRDDHDMPGLPAPDDERFAAWVADAARDYNRPPTPAPREAMWARIEAARAANGAGTRAPADAAPTVVPIAARRDERTRARRPWILWGAGLAAGLLAGVLGERLRSRMETPRDAAPAVAHVERAAPRDTMRVAQQHELTGPNGTLPPAGPSLDEPSGPQAGPPDDSGARVSPRNPRPPRAKSPTVGPRSPLPAPSQQVAAAPEASTFYRVAAVQTLTQAEALLTAYKAYAPNDTASRQVGRWARDVLSSTRLLLDSPAARDPKLHRLLDDLELVLAQIVQLSGAPLTAQERDLVDRALRDGDLLTRIRSAVPAGPAAAS